MTDIISKERLEKIAFGSVRQSQEEGVFIAREALAYREAESERCNAGEPWCPDSCPITGRKFFMWMSHPTKGMVPTYGGPYDSYTLAEKDSDGEYVSERFDHDNGYWSDFECAGVNVVEDWLPTSQQELDEYVADNTSPVLSQPVPDELPEPQDSCAGYYRDGWNDCRAAVLSASPALGQTQALRDIAIRVVACISMSGYSPKEKSLNPLESLLFDAEKALGESK